VTGFEVLAIFGGLIFVYEMTKLIVNRNKPVVKEDTSDEN
jgi:hypothetical protein